MSGSNVIDLFPNKGQSAMAGAASYETVQDAMIAVCFHLAGYPLDPHGLSSLKKLLAQDLTYDHVEHLAKALKTAVNGGGG